MKIIMGQNRVMIADGGRPLAKRYMVTVGIVNHFSFTKSAPKYASDTLTN